MSAALTILVTGASGLIGNALCAHGTKVGWNLVRLRRQCDSARAVAAGAADAADAADGGDFWDASAAYRELANLGHLDAVIHLAGETIAQRWTTVARRRIYESRVRGTEKLGQVLARLPAPPKVVISASAVGYYGNQPDLWIDEDSPSGEGFLAEVCRDWEAAARRCLGGKATRVVQLRTGLVLTPKGGALARMLPVFRLGLGGRLGDGHQYLSWIGLSDLVRAIEYLLNDDRLTGPINAVTPNPVTNAEFTRALGRALHRPTFLGVPRVVISVLLGQMGSELLLSGVRVQPRRLLEAGFEFAEPQLTGALKDCLRTASEKR